jgi:hypothetical protein
MRLSASAVPYHILPNSSFPELNLKLESPLSIAGEKVMKLFHYHNLTNFRYLISGFGKMKEIDTRREF